MSTIVRRMLVLGVAALTVVGLGVTPAAAAPVAVFGSLDTFIEMRDGAYSFTGWRFADDGGPVSIHVYDTGPSRTVGYDLGTARYFRPDVEAVYGRADTGFQGSLPALATGQHRVCVFAVAVRPSGSTPLLLGCRDVLAGRAPVGAIDVVPSRSIQGDSVTVRGWAYDPDEPSTPLQIHAYVNGTGSVLPVVAVPRPDVSAAFPGVGGAQGYQAPVSLATTSVNGVQPSGLIFETGPRSVCLFAIGIGAGGNTLLGCRTVEVETKVRLNLDTVSTPHIGVVTVSGWSYLTGEPAVATGNILMVQSVDYYTGEFDVNHSEFSADRPRPDVAAAFPGVGTNHGYTATSTTPLRPGSSLACVTAKRPSVPIDVIDPLAAKRCLSFDMPNSLGAVDSVTPGEAGPGTATVRGWAIDPTNRSASVTVEAGLRAVRTSPQTFVDATPQQTGVDRPDVNAAFGVTGTHGFEVVVPVPAGFTGLARAYVQLGLYASQPVFFAPFATGAATIG